MRIWFSVHTGARSHVNDAFILPYDTNLGRMDFSASTSIVLKHSVHAMFPLRFFITPGETINMAKGEALRGPAYKPEDCDRIFIRAMTNGDIDAIIALYEDDAVFIRPDGKRATGHSEIRRFLEEEAARKAVYVIQDIVTVLSGDGSIAITRMHVSMSWTGRDGKENSVQTRTIELLRKQPDGTWRFIIDSPAPEMI